MKYKLKFVITVAVIVLVLDHLTKWLVVQYIPLGTHISVFPGLFELAHGRNTGAAFGFLSGWDSSLKNWLFYAIGVFAVFFLYNYLKTVAESDKVSILALGLVLGGALGNILDRIMRGSVVDFLAFHIYDKVWDFTLAGYHVVLPLSWPSFNIADSAISVAVVLLIVQNLRSSQK